MFSYYGSKSKIVDYYPPPKHGKIIEPFAGSARYSLKWFDRDVLLVDKYPVIVDVWHYLQAASKQDILGLPRMKSGDSVDNYPGLSDPEKYLLGFLIAAGVSTPARNVASFEGIGMNRKAIEKIASNLFKIRHWKIIQGDYREIENQSACWFIDPPYQNGGEHYKMSSRKLDFMGLADWCKSRTGQVMVCENTKANWLPFRPVTEMVGSQHTTTEAIWTNYRTHYHAEQLTLFPTGASTP